MNQLDPTLLQRNQLAITQQIAHSAQAAHRSTAAIKLIAVTKTVDVPTMRALFANGLHRFGENRHTVFLDKLAALADLKDQIEWHFIGRLQSRQVKAIINEIDYLHSLDRLSLAQEIQKRAQKPIKCFLQVNVSGEASKAGIEPSQIMDFLRQLEAMDKIIIVGLMTMAPLEASPSAIQAQFEALKNLQLQVAEQKLAHAPCTELSMGMSQDYPIAIQAGATFIRVGSALYQAE